MSRSNKRQRKSARRNESDCQNNKEQFRSDFEWLLKKASFVEFKLHGNSTYDVTQLIVQLVLWAWSSSKKVTTAFDNSNLEYRQLYGAKGAFQSYQGLARAMTKHTKELMHGLEIALHACMREAGRRWYRIGKWIPLAIDGSRATTPRTQSNERAFSAPNYGKGKTAKNRRRKKTVKRRKNETTIQPPQLWITLMWHMGTNTIWSWRLGPSTSSERAHVVEMVHDGHFEKNTLFVGDAGFVGYALWSKIINAGHSFLVRAGANVHLLTQLGYVTETIGGIVYCWPNTAMREKLPPLKLRLVKCRLGKKKKVCMLTNVLDEKELTPSEMVRLYELRWGVEVEFRGLKQTFDRRKLRCRNSDRAQAEMAWSLFGMAVIELFALKQHAKRTKADPNKISFANSLEAIRTSLQQLTHRPPQIPDLSSLLKEAVIDDYDRKSSKKARYKPKRKHKPSDAGAPKVKRATARHRTLAKQMGLSP